MINKENGITLDAYNKNVVYIHNEILLSCKEKLNVQENG